MRAASRADELAMVRALRGETPCARFVELRGGGVADRQMLVSVSPLRTAAGGVRGAVLLGIPHPG